MRAPESITTKATFEENVEDKIDDIYGVTVIDDYLFGADTEAIEKVFVEEKAIFVKTMDGILDKIAQGIADALNSCVGVVKEGRKKTKDYYDSLDKKQQSLAKESYDNYNDQYTSLEDTVYEKEDELASSLADAYKDNVDSLREAFDTIKDKVAAGWIGAAFQAIWGIIKTILKLFEMLMQLLSAVVEAIQVILNDPIGFLMNLIDGVKLGLDNFVSNIKTHLITGLVEWLTGSLGGVGITIPKDLFSLPGIFSLAFQVMGLSWDYFRAKAVKKLGEPVVQGIELAVDIFQIVRKDGALGLWEYIKEKFQDLQATVMDAIRDMIITKVVEAGIKWIISLMNPASAFVKAVLMIIDIAKFFIERAADIIELVMAFIDGIRALAAGNIQGVAKLIEKALAKAIPILLGFLASLLGISGLTAKVTKIIGKIKGKVDKAINKVINKAFGMFKKKGGKGKQTGVPEKEEAGDKNDKALKDGKLGEVVKFNAGESHTLWVEPRGNKSEIMVASDDPGPVRDKLKKWRKEQASKPRSGATTAAIKAIDNAEKNLDKVEKAAKGADALLAQSKTGNFDATKRKELNKLDAQLEKEEKALSKSLINVFTKLGKGGAGNLKDIFDAQSKNFHEKAAPTFDKAFAVVMKLKPEEQEKIVADKLANWTGMEEMLKHHKPATDLIAKPLDQGHPYGKYVRDQLTRVVGKVHEASSPDERKAFDKAAFDKLLKESEGKTLKAIHEQMFRKNTEPQADQALASLVTGKHGEHDLYKPDIESIKYSAEEDTFLLSFAYSKANAEKLPPSEGRTFEVKLKIHNLEERTVSQSTIGRNLTLKYSGTRGKTKSAGGLANKENLKDDVQLNSAHVLADWFTGSGYSEALNLIATSEKYNKETMGLAEKYIVNAIERIEDRNPDKMVTFDLKVVAIWEALKTDKVIETLDSLHKGMDLIELKKKYKSLIGTQEPRRCQSVTYTPLAVFVDGVHDDAALDSIIPQEIKEDTGLNKTFGR